MKVAPVPAAVNELPGPAVKAPSTTPVPPTVKDPPVRARSSLHDRSPMVVLPWEWVTRMSVSRSTVTLSSAPGRRGSLLQLPATCHSPPVSGTHTTSAARAAVANHAAETAHTKTALR